MLDSESSKNVWQMGQFSYKGKNPYRIYIEAITAGNDAKNYVAVDDISFERKYGECQVAPEIADPYYTTVTTTTSTTTEKPLCDNDQFVCKSKKCIQKNQVCDFVEDCEGGDDEENCGICDFEQSLCGWYDDSFGKNQWNRTKASNTNIMVDNTLGNFIC